MKIIGERGIGIGGYTEYLVEAEPERRMIWFRKSISTRHYIEPLELPLPRSLYIVLAPRRRDKGEEWPSNHSGSTRSMFCVKNDGKPITKRTKLFLLPWPNMSARGSFSECSRKPISIPAEATTEQVVEDTIIQSWGITFGYMNYGQRVHEWVVPEWKKGVVVTGHTIKENVIDYYRNWEKLTIEEAAKLPWGTYSPCDNYGYIDKQLSVADLGFGL